MLEHSACGLEPVVAMGRTLATFTQLVQLEIDSWRRYRSALRLKRSEGKWVVDAPTLKPEEPGKDLRLFLSATETRHLV